MVEARLEHTEAQAAHALAPGFIENVAQALVNNGYEIPCSQLRLIAANVLGVADDKDKKQVDELVDAVLRTSVFALHPASDTVTFQSRAMRTYLMSTLDLKPREQPPIPHA